MGGTRRQDRARIVIYKKDFFLTDERDILRATWILKCGREDAVALGGFIMGGI